MCFSEQDYNFQNPDPNWQSNKFKSLRYDPRLAELKQSLMAINLWERQKVQRLFRRAQKGTERGSQKAVNELLQIVEQYKQEHMQTEGSAFMPYALEHQISNNHQGIHVLDQAGNGIPMYVDQDVFLLNTLVIGRVGGGKSSAAFNILQQMTVSRLILDPKNIWYLRAEALCAQIILWPYSVALEIPKSIDLADGLFSMLEGIAAITGLQYGVVPLSKARKLCVTQLNDFVSQTGKNGTICLQDIQHALNLIGLDGIKRDYLASCKAALMLLTEPNSLFATRKGVPVSELLNGDFILPCHRLSLYQSRAIAFYLLNYQLIDSYESLESTHLKSIILIDDSSFFISKPENSFGSGPKTSYLTHVIRKLRGSGRGCIFVDHHVESIFEDIKSLSANWMVVGGLSSTNASEIEGMLNLTKDQVNYLARMKPRECIAYFPSQYPRPVHGLVPEVPSISGDRF
jgi:hypothetical protein